MSSDSFIVPWSRLYLVWTRESRRDNPPMPDTVDRVRRFRQLHEAGCFVIPNPWDVGSARVLVGLGFPALASTSSGFAWSQGRRDAESTLEQTLVHFRTLADAVPVPVNGDFREGFAIEPEAVGAN